MLRQSLEHGLLVEGSEQQGGTVRRSHCVDREGASEVLQAFPMQRLRRDPLTAPPADQLMVEKDWPLRFTGVRVWIGAWLPVAKGEGARCGGLRSCGRWRGHCSAELSQDVHRWAVAAVRLAVICKQRHETTEKRRFWGGREVFHPIPPHSTPGGVNGNAVQDWRLGQFHPFHPIREKYIFYSLSLYFLPLSPLLPPNGVEWVEWGQTAVMPMDLAPPHQVWGWVEGVECPPQAGGSHWTDFCTSRSSPSSGASRTTASSHARRSAAFMRLRGRHHRRS